MVSKQSRKNPNWKAPGRDVVHGFWIQLTSLFEGTAFQLKKILNGKCVLADLWKNGFVSKGLN